MLAHCIWYHILKHICQFVIVWIFSVAQVTRIIASLEAGSKSEEITWAQLYKCIYMLLVIVPEIGTVNYHRQPQAAEWKVHLPSKQLERLTSVCVARSKSKDDYYPQCSVEARSTA